MDHSSLNDKYNESDPKAVESAGNDLHSMVTVSNGSTGLLMDVLANGNGSMTTEMDTVNMEDSSFYDYSYDASVNYIPLQELVPNAVGYGLTLIVGLVGNLLVILSVARFRHMHNVTNIFLLSLASADLLLVTLCVPVKFARFFTFTWQYGEFLCKGVHYLQNLTIICSVLNLTGLSLERYYAILHPMRAKYTCTVAMARRSVLIIWGMSIIMAVPILVGQSHELVGVIRKGYWCREKWSHSVVAKVYNVYMLVVVFVLPLGLMIFAYSSICRRLWQVRYQHSSMKSTESYLCSVRMFSPPPPSLGVEARTFLRSPASIYGKRISSANEDSTRKQVVKMLVFVVTLFALCWGPIMFNNLLVSFDVLHSLHHGYLKPMRQVFWLMAYGNSCLNPIVYGFMSKNFRESFRNTVRVCISRNWPRDATTHRTLWRYSFQAQARLDVKKCQRLPKAEEKIITDPHHVRSEARPSMSSQSSTHGTHIKKSDGQIVPATIPYFD